MASNVVQMVLQIKDGATPALESVSDAADDATASADGRQWLNLALLPLLLALPCFR